MHIFFLFYLLKQNNVNVVIFNNFFPEYSRTQPSSRCQILFLLTIIMENNLHVKRIKKYRNV